MFGLIWLSSLRGEDLNVIVLAKDHMAFGQVKLIMKITKIQWSNTCNNLMAV